MMPEEEKGTHEIWSAFKSGEEEAFSRLFFAYYNRLFGYGMKLVRDEHLVKDVIQDFFLYLFENRESLTNEVNKPTSYLLASFRRRLLRVNDRRKKEQTHRKENAISEKQLFVLGIDDLLIKEESRKMNKQLIVQLLNDLPPRQREILYLKYYQDLSLSEIAETLSISYQVVANHLYRAIKKLQGSDQTRKFAKKGIWFLFIFS